jgi:hypothetical protein
MSALELAIAALNLGVFGAHVLMPWRLAEGEESARRRWALVAPLLLATSLVASLLALGARPDSAIAWGLTHPITGSTPARSISLVMAALALADLFTVFAWRRFDARVWRALAAIGALALAAQALGAELLRTGDGPVRGAAGILAAAALRMPLALAAVEVATGLPRRLTLAAAPALLLLALVWPAELRAALGRYLVTLVAAALLLALSRYAPPSLRRATAVAGLLLALLFLARSAAVSRTLGSHETAHEYDLEPQQRAVPRP